MTNVCRLSRVGLTNNISWPNLRNVQTDKVRKSYSYTTLLTEPEVKSSDVAFLQYTSGSTSLPKGGKSLYGTTCMLK